MAKVYVFVVNPCNPKALHSVAITSGLPSSQYIGAFSRHLLAPMRKISIWSPSGSNHSANSWAMARMSPSSSNPPTILEILQSTIWETISSVVGGFCFHRLPEKGLSIVQAAISAGFDALRRILATCTGLSGPALEVLIPSPPFPSLLRP